MKLSNKNVVITGGARGIGAAIARRFSSEGANIVVADLNQSSCDETAADINGLAVACDVTCEEQVRRLVNKAEDHFGPIDLFCSNAGLCPEEPTHAASASNESWNQCWDVHVMAHVYAARAVLPGMLERQEGYLLQMSSAAGLLSQIGNAAYSASKHAAIGFAESLAITHGDDGIRVSVICPQYVATPLLGYPDRQLTSEVFGVLTPDALAEAVLQGVVDEEFLILPHAEVAQYLQFKSGNYDKWLSTMRALRRKIVASVGSTDLQRMHRLITERK